MVSTLQKKIVAARLAGFGFFGIYVVGLFLPAGAYSQALTLLPFVGVVGSTVYIHLIAKCPKCKAKLPQQRWGLGLDKSVHACPNCGVDFKAAGLPE